MDVMEEEDFQGMKGEMVCLVCRDKKENLAPVALS
jgi:hypothetical protein